MHIVMRLLLLLATLVALVVLFSTMGVMFLVAGVILVPLLFWTKWRNPTQSDDETLHHDKKGPIIEGEYNEVNEDDETH